MGNELFMPQPMPDQDGLPRTAHKILLENYQTVGFYETMCFSTCAVYTAAFIIGYKENLSTVTLIMNGITIAIYLGWDMLMRHLTRPTYSEDSHTLIDAGLDLNIDGGLGDQLKDIVFLATVIHLCTIISEYFWWLLLLLPLKAVWIVYVFNERTPEQSSVVTEEDEAPSVNEEEEQKDKKKKPEKKLKKHKK